MGSYKGNTLSATILRRKGEDGSRQGTVTIAWRHAPDVPLGRHDVAEMLEDLLAVYHAMTPTEDGIAAFTERSEGNTIILTERRHTPTDGHGFWRGAVPTHCEVTRRPIKDEFVDGRTIIGMRWALMHPSCLDEGIAVGLGLGRGQRYQRQEDGKWLKVEG